MSFLIRLREFEPQGWIWVMLVLILTWTNDTAAYLVGSKVGKRPLCPRLSPNKTIEGLIGGLLFTTASSVIFGQLFSGKALFLWGLLGLLAGVMGTVGDLMESTYKRFAQQKKFREFISWTRRRTGSVGQFAVSGTFGVLLFTSV